VKYEIWRTLLTYPYEDLQVSLPFDRRQKQRWEQSKERIGSNSQYIGAASLWLSCHRNCNHTCCIIFVCSAGPLTGLHWNIKQTHTFSSFKSDDVVQSFPVLHGVGETIPKFPPHTEFHIQLLSHIQEKVGTYTSRMVFGCLRTMWGVCRYFQVFHFVYWSKSSSGPYFSRNLYEA